MSELQSERMEKQLKSIRDLFDSAELTDDATRMIQLSRVITQQEKALSAQKLLEKRTIEKTDIDLMRHELTMMCIKVGKKHMTKEVFDMFCDELVDELTQIWINDG